MKSAAVYIPRIAFRQISNYVCARRRALHGSAENRGSKQRRDLVSSQLKTLFPPFPPARNEKRERRQT